MSISVVGSAMYKKTTNSNMKKCIIILAATFVAVNANAGGIGFGFGFNTGVAGSKYSQPPVYVVQQAAPPQQVVSAPVAPVVQQVPVVQQAPAQQAPAQQAPLKVTQVDPKFVLQSATPQETSTQQVAPVPQTVSAPAAPVERRSGFRFGPYVNIGMGFKWGNDYQLPSGY